MAWRPVADAVRVQVGMVPRPINPSTHQPINPSTHQPINRQPNTQQSADHPRTSSPMHAPILGLTTLHCCASENAWPVATTLMHAFEDCHVPVGGCACGQGCRASNDFYNTSMHACMSMSLVFKADVCSMRGRAVPLTCDTQSRGPSNPQKRSTHCANSSRSLH